MIYTIVILLIIVQITLIIAQYKNFFPTKSKSLEEEYKPDQQNDFVEYSEAILDKIDKKISTLEKLIVSADDKIRELQNLPNPTPFMSNFENKEKRNLKVVNIGDSKREKVIELKNKGFGVKEIVKQTGFSKPEVELIINLFKQEVK